MTYGDAEYKVVYGYKYIRIVYMPTKKVYEKFYIKWEDYVYEREEWVENFMIFLKNWVNTKTY